MSRQHFLDRMEQRDKKNKTKQSPAHQRSIKQEAELAQRGAGKLTAGSGNKREKGDIKKYHGVFRVEAKTTTKKSFSITQAMLDKIEDASIPHGEAPAFIIEFINEDQTPLREVAVIPSYLLEVLADRLRDE